MNITSAKENSVISASVMLKITLFTVSWKRPRQQSHQSTLKLNKKHA